MGCTISTEELGRGRKGKKRGENATIGNTTGCAGGEAVVPQPGTVQVLVRIA